MSTDLRDALHRRTCPWEGTFDDCRCPVFDVGILAAIRDALIQGDEDVAAALGLRVEQRDYEQADESFFRVIGDWREVTA